MSSCVQRLHCNAYLSDAQTLLKTQTFRAVVFATFCILFTCTHEYLTCKDLTLPFLSPSSPLCILMSISDVYASDIIFLFLFSGSGTANGFLPPALTDVYPGNTCGQVKASVKLLKGRQEMDYGVPALGKFSA